MIRIESGTKDTKPKVYIHVTGDPFECLEELTEIRKRLDNVETKLLNACLESIIVND